MIDQMPNTGRPHLTLRAFDDISMSMDSSHTACLPFSKVTSLALSVSFVVKNTRSELVSAHPRTLKKEVGTGVSFQFSPPRRIRKIKKIKGLRGGVPRYVAQAIPQIDAQIAEKGHLWMETS